MDSLAVPAYPEPREAAASEPPRRLNNLSLLDGKTFSSTTLAGDMMPPGAMDVGLFHRDTRFLSRLELRVNGHRTVVLSSDTQANLYAQIELASHAVVSREEQGGPENTLHLRREQLLAGKFFERLTLENFNLEPVTVRLEWHFDADFADVFQVRGMLRRQAGRHLPPRISERTVEYGYEGLDGSRRRTVLHFEPPPERLEAGYAYYELPLQPHEKRQLWLSVRPETEGDRPLPEISFAAGLESRRRALHEWNREATIIESSNDVFTSCLETASSDFFALRIAVDPRGARTQEEAFPAGYSGEIIAAGIPWFATIFGRDSLIAAYQSLLLHPRLARETLRFLARWQGRQENDWREEQPGKILHEFREGEMTRAGEMPHSPYYGSVDSTPLFLITLGEAFNWLGDRAWLEELMPAASAAMKWIENYGDLDGDGFVEFQRRSPRGLENQGWKDSYDANLHRDGRFAPAPIALCEVQGYCYDARYRLAQLLRLAGQSQEADRLRHDAHELARRFERRFWMPQHGYYAMALDGHKEQVQVVASNAGHLLWSRIIGQERARQVAQRLVRAEMFTGWGVRTLSADELTFNPLSYHRGSVWPHDNSLIGLGLALYDFKPALLQVFTGLMQAAWHFRNLRLPELFVGVQRRDFDQPVHYPVSCSPQAWASGALFLLLTALLGIRPNAAKKELRIVNPVLPDWLDWLRVRNLHVGQSLVSLEFSRRDQRTFCNVLDSQGERLAISVDFTKKSP